MENRNSPSKKILGSVFAPEKKSKILKRINHLGNCFPEVEIIGIIFLEAAEAFKFQVSSFTSTNTIFSFIDSINTHCGQGKVHSSYCCI